MSGRLKVVLPIVVLIAGGGAVLLMLATAPDVEERPVEPVAPLVEVVPVEPTTHRLRVRTQGTVSARTETDLVPQVAGKVVWVSPRLVSGGFFAADDVLLEIEPVDYEYARERARAALARAESEYARAHKELKRLQGLTKTGIASESQLDDVERSERVTAATLQEARAAVALAERDLERTKLRAPFAGRVRRENVDAGQFVSRGAPIAHLYAIDRAEVRLPVADAELEFIDLPLLERNGLSPPEAPEVVLRAEFAGRQHEWRGRVVRTEGEIDARSRLVNVVAAVDDPYGDNDGAPPLAVGLFVEADIMGKELAGVVVVPRAAMRDRDHLLVVDADDRLRLRRAEVIRRERRDVVLSTKTFAPGDRIVTSAVETAVDGMRVRAVPSGTAPAAVANPGEP